MNIWLELVFFNLFLWVVVVFWQLLSEWWESRGGGAAFPRSGMFAVGLVVMVLLNVVLGPVLYFGAQNA